MSAIYRSDEMINKIQKQIGVKFSAENRSAMQKIIREYFIKIHLEACSATEIAKNKSVYITPNFND